MSNIEFIDSIYYKMINEMKFEKRKQQYKMSKIILDNFENNNSCIIEAPTGIGKTLAYLIPSFVHSKMNNKIFVVSTNTINLQQQLVEKDIPLLESILKDEIEYAIVKGRSNYVCGSRLRANCKNQDIIKWFENTKTGDKAEIDFYIDPTEWANICSDIDFCKYSNCAKSDDCYFYVERKKLNNKQILIVNHSILFSDYIYDNILPEYDTLIIDEAHNIENIARNSFQLSFDFKDVLAQIGIMYNNQNNTGVLINYTNSLNMDISAIVDSLKKILNNLYSEVLNIYNKLDIIMYNKKNKELNIQKIIPEFSNFYTIIQNILNEYVSLDIEVKKLKTMTESIESDEKNKFEGLYNKLTKSMQCLEKMIEKEDNNILWISQNNYDDLSLNLTQIDISKELKNVFSDKNVVLTSATMRVNNSFDYFVSRIGLDYFNQYYLKSPFDYDNNMKIFVNSNNIEPNDDKFMDFAVEYINEFLQQNTLGTFILCTSYAQLKYIKENIIADDFNVYCQGDLSRHKLIKEFTSNEKSILIGTDSFWEGVDVKGDKLSNIIIIKLPFLVPDGPVVEAIIENEKKLGNNPFMSYQLPFMVIKLRQGIGRLIRSMEDKGEVHILDNRIIKKHYGKAIINSLPTKISKKI